MNIIKQIKAEVERRQKENFKQKGSFAAGRVVEDADILSFLSTLESEKPVPNDLEEAARKHQEGVPVDTTIHYCGADEDVYFANRIVDAAIFGAKWQAEQDEKELSEKIVAAYQLGLADKEKQMLSEAVEGEVINDNRGNNVVRAGAFNKNFEYGDKVRIIVRKKED